MQEKKRLKTTIGVLGVGALMLTGAGCGAQTVEPAAGSPSTSATGSGAASPPAMSSPDPEASQTPQATTDPEDLYPVLGATAGENDTLPAKADLGDIEPQSVRWLGGSAYASQFVSVTKDNEVCLIAWAIPGDGDGTSVDHGTAAIECSDTAEVLDAGLGVRIAPLEGRGDLVAFLLPPDMEMAQVRKTVLAIPGNHEDLRPPVEINSNIDGSITLAMDVETADELGSIQIPRPHGKALSLSLSTESGS